MYISCGVTNMYVVNTRRKKIIGNRNSFLLEICIVSIKYTSHHRDEQVAKEFFRRSSDSVKESNVNSQAKGCNWLLEIFIDSL